MPAQAPVSQRLIQRLAEGVQRSRLVEPVLAARPPLVVISAPSGYGKTVLAAQIASSGAFSDVAWIRSAGEAGSIRDALAQVARHFTGSSVSLEVQTLPELCHICSSELSLLSDDHAVLVVIDDASWAGDPECCRIVEDVFSEAPVGTIAVVTTRAELLTASGPTRAWSISAAKLMLTDAEIAEAWRRHARRSLTETQVTEVAGASGRHAALVSLMARHAALLDEDVTRIEHTTSVSSLLQTLIFDQVGPADRELLDYAAVLREGAIETLAAVSNLGGVSEGLTRLSNALPLVSVSTGGARRRFVVHALVGEVLGSVGTLAARDPGGLQRITDELAAAGASARALEIAVESGLHDHIADSVRRFGPHLLKGASWELVRSALDALPAGTVAVDPGLLLVRAEVAWVEWAKTDAIRQATLAIRLSELSGDHVVPRAARSLLAGMRMSVADYAGAIADLEPVLEADEISNPDELADAVYAALPAYGFLGDIDGLSRCRRTAAVLVSRGGAEASRLARIEMVMGIVADFVDGDSLRAAGLLHSAASRADVPAHWRSVALCNSAASALEAGDIDLSRSEHAQAAMTASNFSTPLDRALLAMVANATDALEGAGLGTRPETDRVILACETEGETFTLVSTCAIGTVIAAALRDFEYALRLSERGVRASVETASPVLLWQAELVNAQASLAIGDVQRARLTAERILPQVEAIGAMGHVLHARMILAQAALNDGDLASAVEHLSAVSDHIVEKSPALAVASYLRAFPGMFGPLALAMGVDRIPVRVLNLMKGQYGAEALEQAAAVLTPTELARLSARMRMEAERAAELEKAVETDAVCTVRLFGGLEVITPRGPVGERDWTKRKARLLFAMLLSRFGTDVPRGEIIEYLWPEMDEERALNNFYVVWSAMKRALSPESVRETPCPFVEHMHGVCRVVPGRVVSDLDRFAELLGVARQARSDGDASSELAALRSVADLYRGEVLPGDVYDDWFAPLRERFRHDFEDAMLRASQLLEERGDPRGGLSMLRHAMSHDPWREDLYQASLRLQIAAGQRSAAIETYMSCRNRLVEDLGIDPSRETTALYEQVLGMEEGP